MKIREFDAIVIGGGHAGIEAIFALAKKNKNVALISLSKDKLAMMPCNPSIGGPAKGIITREIDALGGMQGLFSDKAMIQIKMLNSSKGPAVRALRAQIDKEKYSKIAIKEIEKNKNITFIEGMVVSIEKCNNKITGIKLATGEKINSQVVIITTGTYMDSTIFRGQDISKGGPDNQETTNLLSESLRDLDIELQRLKTGTPPRVATDSIDFSQVEKEVLPKMDISFSFRSNIILDEQISCYLTYTTPETHKIIRDNINKSSLYSGAINGIGPRYCPSIEDKVIRFSDKERHQVFYEPETKEGDVIYVQGVSTSMPIDVQDLLVRSLPGMKNARIVKYAYAIEYDAIDPIQLKQSLELKTIDGLFFAGQVNGTSGYEEAACQGLIAGINAANKIDAKDPLILRRDQAYIGVLIDDLVTKGTKEPYRMLTSRAEYRLILRNDNADERLSQIGFEQGLINGDEIAKINSKYESIKQEILRLSNIHLSSNHDLAKKYNAFNGPSYLDMIGRPEVDFNDFSNFEYIYNVWVKIRLEGYVKKQETEAKKLYRLEALKIPTNFNWDEIPNLASEARIKLKKINPTTIGQTTRISGINPADVQMIMFFMEQKRRKNEH